MKDIIDNNTPDVKMVNEYIKENKKKFKKRFENKYKFIRKYPFVLEYPHFKTIENSCECCNTILSSHQMTWNNGWRPKVKEFAISLHKIAPLLVENKSNDHHGEFVEDFRKAFSVFKNK